jgi:phosphatidylglycerophosphate synthase
MDPTIANGSPVRGGSATLTAVVVATAPATSGGPAALLPLGAETILGRLTGQLAGLGVRTTIVLTRPAWETAVREAVDGDVEVRTSSSTAGDLRALGALAAATNEPLVVMYGDIVAHGEALRGLIVDPRASTAILAGGKRRRIAFRVQARRGRIVSAASAYHAVGRANGTFLGVIRAAPADLETLAATTERLAALVEAPPPSWQEELERKEGAWRLTLARWAAAGGDEDDGEAGDDDHPEPDDSGDEPVEATDVEVVLSDDDEIWLQNRLAAAREDAVALVLLGLIRGGAQISGLNLRRLFWTRPLTPAAAANGADRLAECDEDRLLLDSAVKAADGFFTTHFVSPYSKYIARWAARRGLTPNQVTTASMVMGLLAAAGFATGERWGLVAGAVMLQLAFTTDCVDGQLARYTRQFSKFGAWLDSVFDRGKEYVAFAGLAIGASRAGDPVWLLACCALTVQTIRHMSDFAYGATQQQSLGIAARQPPLDQARDSTSAAAAQRAMEPDAAAPPAPGLAQRALGTWAMLDRVRAFRWLKRMITFPIGERFAVISITAALFTPRVTFIALLTWGAVGIVYTQAGRVLRALR